ncbi:hypothetical protein CYMTET_26806 [Cymbomonas tetramitiformis]|uniref:Peptidase S9 prolyl oligopeptidase catalytic domain-containing protein n=1 Tax=Cymbomonas tetramitiformis TaxID=36881 RepID=A0AAE0KXM2_9CHLO|nr:hypothetical protein CYMTET_26806 [Cymbomonas tetramitiformis]
MRVYSLYVPQTTCDAQKPAPLVVAVPCFGCDSSTFDEYHDLCDEYGFILASPRGTGSVPSFNAQHCCGEALDNKMDDVGFIIKMVEELARELGSLSSSDVFAIGWSNGGYLISLIAMHPASPFKAIAPISGHQYHGYQNITSPLPVFMHHSRNDRFVRYTGCCTDHSKPRCCCGIPDDSPPSCTSAQEVFDQWASDVNHCKGSSYTAYEDHSTGVTCFSVDGCQASSHLCQYRYHGHFNSPRHEFPLRMRQAIFSFFLRETCSSSKPYIEKRVDEIYSTSFAQSFCLVTDRI